jgi:glycosyltransferase involved in cell wall biosynthesis
MEYYSLAIIFLGPRWIMRLALIHTHFDHLDGSTRFVLEVCKNLESLGCEVTIICLNANLQVISEYPEVKKSILSLNEPPPRSVDFWIRLPSIQRKVRKLIYTTRPNWVIANASPCQYLVPNIPESSAMWYCHEASASIYSLKNLSTRQRAIINVANVLLNNYDKRKVRSIEKIASNSHFAASILRRVYGRDSAVIYPGVDCFRFRPIKKKQSMPKILLFVGLLLKGKRPDLMIHVARLLSAKRHDFRVIFAGDGPEYARLKYLAQLLGVSDVVEFKGCLPQNGLVELYSKATAVVYPSVEESFGLVPLEAMSCGTPVIACKSGGPSETIVDGKTGFLVDPHDMNQLVDKLELLLSDSRLVAQMGQESRKHTIRRFGWDRVAKEICGLCESSEPLAI